MSNVITDVIVHKLLKESGQRTAALELRQAPLPVTATVQRLIDELYRQYAIRTSKGFGKFEADDSEYPVQRYLRAHLQDGTPFLALSNQLMAHLQTRAANESFATGGYVLIAKIDSGGHQFLLCAIVTEVIGTAITAGLDVIDSVHLDMNQLRVAGRVDLTTWLAGGERYISFLKGRSTDVSSYFKLFLGCNDVHAPLEESQKLVDALNDFAEQQQLTPEARDAMFSLAHGYLTGLSKNMEPVELEAFSNHMWPSDPQVLRDVLTEPERAISDGFVPDRRALSRLVKFEGKSQYWQLKVDRQGIRNQDVCYDEQNDRIILNNIPEQLRKALLRNSSEGRSSPDPRRTYPTRTVTGVPSCVKRFRMAARTCNSAT